MARPTNETGLVKVIVRAIKREYPDALVWKVHGGSFQKIGLPDLAVCVHGLYVGIEVKHQKPGESEAHARNRTSPIQRTRIQEIIKAGGMAGTALSEEEALEIIERGLRRLRERMDNESRDHILGRNVHDEDSGLARPGDGLHGLPEA